ncbi:MAG: adaptor protein MecA [Lactobacillales bacterium]|nr:adaptor protein MecA [Lactobacillales bacterium]MDR1253986.1 adaptor protein MecA [Oscillospiraceae bacterium]
MILECISKRKLLIALSNEEMKKFDLTFKQSNWNNNYVHNIIRKMLLVAMDKTGFNAANHDVIIEAMPRDEGCVMVVTLLANNKYHKKLYKIKDRTEPLIFAFDTLEDLLNLVERIYKLNINVDHNQIIQENNAYYIIIYAKQSINKKILPIICEYGRLHGKGFVESARYNEKGKTIIIDDAINTLGKKLAVKKFY